MYKLSYRMLYLNINGILYGITFIFYWRYKSHAQEIRFWLFGGPNAVYANICHLCLCVPLLQAIFFNAHA